MLPLLTYPDYEFNPPTTPITGYDGTLYSINLDVNAFDLNSLMLKWLSSGPYIYPDTNGRNLKVVAGDKDGSIYVTDGYYLARLASDSA